MNQFWNMHFIPEGQQHMYVRRLIPADGRRSKLKLNFRYDKFSRTIIHSLVGISTYTLSCIACIASMNDVNSKSKRSKTGHYQLMLAGFATIYKRKWLECWQRDTSCTVYTRINNDNEAWKERICPFPSIVEWCTVHHSHNVTGYVRHWMTLDSLI